MSRLLNIQKCSNHFSGSSTNIVRNFDPNSGQFFHETISFGGSMTTDWAWKTVGSPSDAQGFRSRGRGCASLSDMAIRSAIVHCQSISLESLQELPWNVGAKLWRKLKHFKLDSVRTWTIFASAYQGVPEEALKRKHHVIHEPDTTFSNYISPLTSQSFRWITSLTLSHVSCSRTDLVKLSQLVNLGVLTIGHRVTCPDVGLDDSIIRAWGRAAAESGAFSMLRVLMCRSQREITTRLFGYLNSFPSLSSFNVEDCNIGPQDKTVAFDAGWKYLVGKELNEYLAKNGAQSYSWDSIVQPFFCGGGEYSIEILTAEGVEAVKNLPMLHCSLGAAPLDAAIDLRGNQGMKSFQRTKNHMNSPVIQAKNLKRPHENLTQSNNLSRKKPAMRTSKTQSMEQILAQFN